MVTKFLELRAASILIASEDLIALKMHQSLTKTSLIALNLLQQQRMMKRPILHQQVIIVMPQQTFLFEPFIFLAC